MTAAVALPGSAGATPEPLPALREDLKLLPGPPALDGSATWNVFDPVRNRYFRIGHAAFELLSRWGEGRPDALLARLHAETTLRTTQAELDTFIRFLRSHNLVRGAGAAQVEEYRRQAGAARRSLATRLLHGYLFFRIPLVRPDRFLDATLRFVQPLYTRAFLALVLAIGGAGLFLAARQWDRFVHTFLHFFSTEGLVYYAAALAATKVLHELGHAYTAKRYGCRVPTMGVAFLVLWPVLYTDTSDAWRLTARRQRLAIGAAGMTAELAVALVATFLWSFLADGPARSAAFFLATASWVMTLTINLSPLMRFDGYYLLSDWLGIENLQERAFALARWRLRELLFGLGDPPPETFPPRLRRILIGYAYAAWIYRFVLFLGIALVVYHLFFKLLGLFLFAVEIGWFIVRPVWHELRDWWQRRERLRLNAHAAATLGLLAAGIALLAIPWQGHIELPALQRAARYAVLYPETAAQLAEINARRDQPVRAGDVLFRLTSPEIDNQLRQRESSIALLNLKIRRQAGSEEDLQNLRVLEQELAADLAARAGLLERRERLEVRAPFDGVLMDVTEALRPGLWMAKNQPLARLVAPGEGEAIAYVREPDLDAIRTGARARFYPEDLTLAPVDAVVTMVDTASVKTLDQPYQASVYQGEIATEERPDGTLAPVDAVYRVRLSVAADADLPDRVVRGAVRVEAEGLSALQRLWRTVAAVVIRESGF